MQIFTAKTRQNAKTVTFPQAVEVTGLQDLLAAAQHDHIFSQMKDNYRSTENFLQTDCLVLDLDNTHSEDPNDWKSIDDIADAFQEVHFYYVQSRNYMKAKTKGGRVQEPREKYHLYFPLSKPLTKRASAKKALDAAGEIADHTHGTTGLLDQSAAKPEQLMYGVEDPQGGEITGELCLDEYLRQPDVKAIWKPALADDKKPEQTDAQEGLQPVGLEWKMRQSSAAARCGLRTGRKSTAQGWASATGSIRAIIRTRWRIRSGAPGRTTTQSMEARLSRSLLWTAPAN